MLSSLSGPLGLGQSGGHHGLELGVPTTTKWRKKINVEQKYWRYIWIQWGGLLCYQNFLSFISLSLCRYCVTRDCQPDDNGCRHHRLHPLCDSLTKPARIGCHFLPLQQERFCHIIIMWPPFCCPPPAIVTTTQVLVDCCFWNPPAKWRHQCLSFHVVVIFAIILSLAPHIWSSSSFAVITVSPSVCPRCLLIVVLRQGQDCQCQRWRCHCRGSCSQRQSHWGRQWVEADRGVNRRHHCQRPSPPLGDWRLAGKLALPRRLTSTPAPPRTMAGRPASIVHGGCHSSPCALLLIAIASSCNWSLSLININTDSPSVHPCCLLIVVLSLPWAWGNVVIIAAALALPLFPQLQLKTIASMRTTGFNYCHCQHLPLFPNKRLV